MKKLLIPTLLLVILLLTGYTMLLKKETRPVQQQSENQTKEISRKDELQLEGFINDYFYRRQIKDSFLFGDFDAYGSVLTKSIEVYVYPKNTLPQGRADDIKKIIENGLQSTLFDFPDFEWAKKYSFDVVVK